ncbi:AAA family ATPase [Candidatus Saccharibacteria bacterium]|nr:AAA family ATPase [Candidatus Saccharibacteria bacterium]
MNFTPSVLKVIDERYRATLQNLNVSNPRVMILFSGPPGSGKSTVAKAVTERFKAVRLENDVVRIIATELSPEWSLQQKADLCCAYMEKLRSKLISTVPNGLLVVDASIDRQYQEIFNFTKQNSFKTILLAMQIPEAMHREWITNAGNMPYASLEHRLATMRTRRQEQDRFLKHHNPDMVLTPGYKIDDVFRLIDPYLLER